MKKKMIIISSAILATLITGTVLFLPRNAKATDETATKTTEAITISSESEETSVLRAEEPEYNPFESIKVTTEEIAESVKNSDFLPLQVSADETKTSATEAIADKPVTQKPATVNPTDNAKVEKTRNPQPIDTSSVNETDKNQPRKNTQQVQPTEASEKGTNETNSEGTPVSTKDTDSASPVSVKTEDEKSKTPTVDSSSKKKDKKPSKPEAPVETKTEKPTEKKTEAPKCNHTWVWATHTETKTIPEVCHDVPVYDDGWDEPVYAQKVYCSECESLYDSSEAFYAKDHCHGNSGLITVVDHYIHHEPEILYYDTIVDQPERQETVTVKDYQYCSICGERK